MVSQKPSFSASWRLLTRDKGWIKPILVLTLVGMVPIVGQIAILGYGLEWARLTAWGVEAAPKQSRADYGKIMHTGFFSGLVMLSMSFVIAILDIILFGTGMAGAAFPMLSGVSMLGTDLPFLVMVLVLVINLFLGVFVSVATMRATVYDKFSAGWRLDRIFEMIGKDVAGFFRIYLVTLISGLIGWAYSMIIGVLTAAVFFGSFIGAAAVGGYSMMGMSSSYADSMMLGSLFSMGSGLAMIVVIFGVILLFIGGVIGTAMQLISLNAVGQWFSRFDVQRWGLSGDPLPDGVPLPITVDESGRPVEPQASSAAAPESPATPVPPVEPVTTPIATPQTPQAGETAPESPISDAAHDEAAGPVVGDGVASVEPYQPEDAAPAAQEPTPLPAVSEGKPADEDDPVSSTSDAEVAESDPAQGEDDEDAAPEQDALEDKPDAAEAESSVGEAGSPDPEDGDAEAGDAADNAPSESSSL